ncbi:hypothetical protein HS088_TW01G00979 [Tripterygium wilfordii]|uniref:Pentatricopeptide repeat-containing protein n=1 Tax=Tripterygium wilfordii TaxID=458696 RepID=A0A7J7E3G7_TRIWF|nr:pentatricopeptide repeat-containing protein At3g51320-like [Tripterygium wilfordii]KAF5753061.1 hypothetical protein HS088_TW01G00979 [Tripterygium wilfordii]
MNGKNFYARAGSIQTHIRNRNCHLELLHSNPTLSQSRSPSPSCSSVENRTFSIYHSSLKLLRGCTCRSIKQLLQIQAHLLTSGIFYNPYWSSRVLQHSLHFGDFDYTVLIFGCIDSPNTFCVNTLIEGYSNSSIPRQAVGFYFEMLKNGFSPNSFTFVPLFGCCAKAVCVESGQKLHGQAVKTCVDWVLPVQNSLIHMYGYCGAAGYARKVFDLMSQKDLVSWNSILHCYAGVGDLNVARKLFDIMPERNVVSWNTIINGYLNGGKPEVSLLLYREMVEKGLRMNDTTAVCMLTACGRSARLKEGRSLHGFLYKTVLKFSIMIYTALIDMYSRCQKVGTARRVFNLTTYRNLVCWNAMILGYCIHGNPEDGLKLYAEMANQFRSGDGETNPPDEVTFISILCACARTGKLTEGRKYFSEMVSVYNIKPNFAHYWCMANVHVSAGLVQEAEEILRNLPGDIEDLSSEFVVWANLLASCRFQGDIELGERIAKSLIDREPRNFAYYRLLLNIYAVAGRWEDVAAVKDVMEERRIGRIPGSRLVDLKEIVHGLKVKHILQEVILEVT